MGRVTRTRPMREAGELLAVEAIDRTGLAVTSEGAFVRLLAVTPPNPLVLGGQDRRRIAEGYCQLIARLKADERLQFYVVSRPVDLKTILEQARREVSAAAGEPPDSLDDPAHDPLSMARWRMYFAMQESLRLHSDEQAAVQTSFYVVCPWVAPRRSHGELWRDLLPRRHGLLSAPLRRSVRAHRRAARESLAFTEGIRSELDALQIPTRLVNGEQLVELLWSRFNPTSADRGVRQPPRATEILGDLDSEVDLTQARQVAHRLRSAIAQSPLDFTRSPHHVEVEHDIEQTVFVATTADHTSPAWLMGAMLTREPFTLSVHVAALDRRRERNRLKMRYRRLYAVNRGAESRGRVPDWDRYAQEEESAHLLKNMAGDARMGLFEVSMYLSIRGRGPQPDLAAQGEAIDFCVEALTSTGDVAVNRGAHHQQRLWPSTLPLGRDVARYTRPYATRNVGDCVPLAGTSCGSPEGIPFAFSSPGRTLERINPFDRLHDNYSLLVAGKSGAGKTLATLVIIARCFALGIGRIFVIDRSRHHLLLSKLIPGSAHLDIGSDDSPWAINPWDTPNQGAVPRAKVAYLVALHCSMAADESLSALERSHLGAAIRETYARAHAHEVPARESMLRDVLFDRAKQEAAAGVGELAASLRSLAERLGEFCGQGAYSYVFDRPTNIPEDSPLVVFDTEQCPEEILGPVMFMAVEYVTRHVRLHREEQQHLVGHYGVPRLNSQSTLVINEAWHEVAIPETGVHVAKLAREARRIGLFFIIQSQQFADLDTEHGRPLLRNCSMAIQFRQEDEAELEFTQHAFGVSPEQAAMVPQLRTVKGRYSEFLWLNGLRGKGRERLPVGPTEYWMHTSEPHVDVPMREAAIAEHDGDVWRAIRALARQGVPTEGEA